MRLRKLPDGGKYCRLSAYNNSAAFAGAPCSGKVSVSKLESPANQSSRQKVLVPFPTRPPIWRHLGEANEKPLTGA